MSGEGRQSEPFSNTRVIVTHYSSNDAIASASVHIDRLLLGDVQGGTSRNDAVASSTVHVDGLFFGTVMDGAS